MKTVPPGTLANDRFKNPMIKKSDAAQFIQGLLMGSANIIPGASGGTIALILGIYQRLITAVSHFDRVWIRALTRRDWETAVQHIDLRFLVTLALGVVVGTISLGSLMHTLLEDYEARTLAVFFGLIAASTVLVARRITHWSFNGFTLAAIGGAIAYMIGESSPDASNAQVSFFYLFCCGAIAISAMILPGISGALILLLLGAYKQVTGYLKELSRGVITEDNIFGILIFIAGCGIGLLIFTKVLRVLLDRYYDLTLCTLCGFMAGSLRSLWPWAAQQPPTGPPGKQIGIFLGLAVAGALGVLLLEKISTKKDVGSEVEP